MESGAGGPVRLEVHTSPDWPIFSTLSPRLEPPAAKAEFAADYFGYVPMPHYTMVLEYIVHHMAHSWAPDYINDLSLRDLSRLGSTQNGEDFRIGRNLFSRGAKSFHDVMLGLLSWTEKHQRAFAYEEIEPIMSESVGVDLSAIRDRWQELPQ